MSSLASPLSPLLVIGRLIAYLVILFVYGPPAAVNCWFLQQARRDPLGRRMRWIEVDAIAAAWTGAAAGLILLVLWFLGANPQILGWLAVLVAIYTVTVLGFDPRFGHVIIGILMVAVIGLVIAMALRDGAAHNWIVANFLALVYESGMDFYPLPTAILSGVVALFVVAETVFELVMKRNSVDGNHYNLARVFQGESSLKRDDYHIEHDISDFLEYRMASLVTLIFVPTKDGLTRVRQKRVPWGLPVVQHLRRLTKETDVQIAR